MTKYTNCDIIALFSKPINHEYRDFPLTSKYTNCDIIALSSKPINHAYRDFPLTFNLNYVFLLFIIHNIMEYYAQCSHPITKKQMEN